MKWLTAWILCGVASIAACDRPAAVVPPTSVVPPAPLPLATPEQRIAIGRDMFTTKGCAACHSQGSFVIGGDLRDLRHGERTFTDGSSLALTEETFEAYARESILDPRHRIVAGEDPIMPRIHLSDDELDVLVEYLRCRSGPDETVCGASLAPRAPHGSWPYRLH